MAELKPIIHGTGDPTEIPFYCKRCKFYNSNGSDFPKCTRREDGKFKPEVAFTCYLSKKDGISNGV